jgi:hypothetical protein
MPRKDKKKKNINKKIKNYDIKKIANALIKPINTKKKLFITPPKGKPCVDCGYKSGSGFSVPFGFADRLGTQRLSTQSTQPIININLGDYLAKLKEPLPKEHIPIVATKKKAEVIYTTPYIPLEESINYLEPLIKPKITLPTEEVYVLPKLKKTEQEQEPAVIVRRGRPTGTTELNKLIDLFINEKGMTVEDATQSAMGYTLIKGGVKDKIKQFEEQIKINKEGKK